MPKKIIFLTRSYYPNIGGVEKHIYEVCRNLDKNKYKILIITESTNTNEKKSFDFDLPHVQIIRIPIKNRNWFLKFHIWKWMWDQKELFRDADIIHCHDVFFWYIHLACLYPLKNVYTTFHGYEQYPIKNKAIIYRKIFEYMSNKTICIGDFMRKWYHARPSVVCYGGVNRKKQYIKYKKDSAIFIGRLDEHTGILDYLEAVALIRKFNPKFTLTVFGDGELRSKINQEGVIVMGNVPNADDFIPQFEYAFMSRYLSILESLSYQREVFALYDNPVKKDYLKQSIFAPYINICRTPKQLAEHVLHKERDDSRIKKGHKLSEEMTWANVAMQYRILWGYAD